MRPSALVLLVRSRSRRPLLLACATAVTLLSIMSPAAAQPAAGVDLTFTDNWVWRGVTRAGSHTLQPAAWARVDGHGHALAAGAWGSFELAPGAITTSGHGKWQLGEVDVWSQATARLGTTDLAAGVVRYLYPADAGSSGRTSAFNTTEAYVQVQPRPGTLPIEPKVTLYWDVDRVHGGYVEVSA
ncbi:MAG TPA: hypothetical protein VF771_04435, partial [Longimicrobiaceae bacterium]